MRMCIRAAAMIAGLFVVLSASSAKAGWYGFTGGAYTIGAVGATGFLNYGGALYFYFQHSFCTGTNNSNGTCSVALSTYNWAIPVSSATFPVYSALVSAAIANPKSAMQVGCNTCTSFTTTPPGMTGTWTFWSPEGITVEPR